MGDDSSNNLDLGAYYSDSYALVDNILAQEPKSAWAAHNCREVVLVVLHICTIPT